jgi:ABC-type multidrug transport system ATPase subunit
MNELKLSCVNLEKKFNGKIVFTNLNLEMAGKSSLVVTGKNGSGKSTFLKILSGLIRSDKGTVEFSNDEGKIPKEEHYKYINLMSPYLNLYDELTGYENLEFYYDLRKNQKKEKEEKINYLFELIGLYNRRNDYLGNYSSGMIQRVKLAFSILHEPHILLLDEPRSNLDKEGIEVVYKVAEIQKNKGILIVATNEIEDTKLCNNMINIEDYKRTYQSD